PASSSASGRAVTGTSRLFHPKGKIALGPVAVTGNDAPEHAISACRQRRETDLVHCCVRRIYSRIALVDLSFVGVLDAKLAEHGLDLPVEPDADCRRWRVPR